MSTLRMTAAAANFDRLYNSAVCVTGDGLLGHHMAEIAKGPPGTPASRRAPAGAYRAGS